MMYHVESGKYRLPGKKEKGIKITTHHTDFFIEFRRLMVISVHLIRLFKLNLLNTSFNEFD